MLVKAFTIMLHWCNTQRKRESCTGQLSPTFLGHLYTVGSFIIFCVEPCHQVVLHPSVSAERTVTVVSFTI